MKKLLLILMIAFFGNFAAQAATPKTETRSDAKTTESVASPAVTKTSDAVAYFAYIGPIPAASGDLLVAANYGNTQVNPGDVCDDAGSNGCAALFTVSGSTHTGSPSDIHTKQ
jgi:hypothetical protein